MLHVGKALTLHHVLFRVGPSVTAPEDNPNRRDEDYQGEPNSSTSERVYRSFLRAYPKELRWEYGEEMARTFRDLRRRELESRGVRGLAVLWSRTLLELVSTALTERSIMLTRNFSRNAYLPARPVVVKKWGGLAALVGGAMGTIGYYVGTSISLQLSSIVLLLSSLFCTLALFGLYGTLAERSERSGYPGRLAAAGAVLAAVSVLSWLAMGVFSALAWLLAWQWTVVSWAVVSVPAFCCWLVGLALLAIAAFRARLSGGLNIMPLVVISLVPISMFLPFLTTLGMPIVTSLPFIGSALLGWFLLKNTVTDGLAEPSRAGSGFGLIARRAAMAVSPGSTANRTVQSSASAKEKEVLEALRRNGELAVAGVALETSLSVEEADGMLSALAARGHLDVRVVRGRLLYSLWEGKDPVD